MQVEELHQEHGDEENATREDEGRSHGPGKKKNWKTLLFETLYTLDYPHLIYARRSSSSLY